MSGKQSPSMNHLLSTTLPSAQTREINLKLMSEGWDPCPDWIVTCGGRAEMEEERVSHLPPHPSSQRAVTSLRDGSIHSLMFSAPLSLLPSLSFSLHKRLPTGVPAPCLYEKPKPSKKPLILPELNLFMRNQPRFLPSKPSHSRDARKTRGDIRIQPEIRREGAEVLKTLRPGVEKRLCLGEGGAALVWGSRASEQDRGAS